MKIRKTFEQGLERWLVDVGVVDGKRRRMKFSSEQEAKRKLMELERDRKQIGKAWADIPCQERAGVVRVLREMRGHGAKLDVVWAVYLRGQGKAEVKRVTLSKATAECIEFKAAGNRRSAYVDSLESYLDQFTRGRGEMAVSEVTLDAIEDWLKAQRTPGSKQTWRNRLSTFFAFCLRRGYVAENLVRRTESVRVDFGRPKILQLRFCRRLMRAAELMDPAMAPGLALKLFAGVRPQEARRLKWGDVQLDRLELVIDAAAAKKRDVRIVALPANCGAWLKSRAERRDPPGEELVIPAVNYRKRMDAIKARARVPAWPHDVLRHTAVSHWYEIHGEVVTSKQMGHSERVMFANYRAMVKRRETELFFKIRPCASRIWDLFPQQKLREQRWEQK